MIKLKSIGEQNGIIYVELGTRQRVHVFRPKSGKFSDFSFHYKALLRCRVVVVATLNIVPCPALVCCIRRIVG